MTKRKIPHMMRQKGNENVKVVLAGWGGVNSPFLNGNVAKEDKTWITIL